MSQHTILPVIVEHIVRTPGVCGGKPRIANTRIRVQDIVVWHERRGMSPEQIVGEFPQLTLADVHAALAFYFDNQETIQQEIEAGKEFAEQQKAAQGPGLLDSLRASNDDSLPSG